MLSPLIWVQKQLKVCIFYVTGGLYSIPISINIDLLMLLMLLGDVFLLKGVRVGPGGVGPGGVGPGGVGPGGVGPGGVWQKYFVSTSHENLADFTDRTIWWFCQSKPSNLKKCLWYSMFKIFGGLCSPKNIKYVLPTVEAKQILAQITSLYLIWPMFVKLLLLFCVNDISHENVLILQILISTITIERLLAQIFAWSIFWQCF